MAQRCPNIGKEKTVPLSQWVAQDGLREEYERRKQDLINEFIAARKKNPKVKTRRFLRNHQPNSKGEKIDLKSVPLFFLWIAKYEKKEPVGKKIWIRKPFKEFEEIKGPILNCAVVGWYRYIHSIAEKKLAFSAPRLRRFTIVECKKRGILPCGKWPEVHTFRRLIKVAKDFWNRMTNEDVEFIQKNFGEIYSFSAWPNWKWQMDEVTLEGGECYDPNTGEVFPVILTVPTDKPPHPAEETQSLTYS